MVFFTDKPSMPTVATLHTYANHLTFPKPSLKSNHHSQNPFISFTGLDFRLFKQATLQIEFTGEGSFHKLKALLGHVHVSFKPHTKVCLELQLGLKDGHPEVEKASLKFDPALRIFNLAQGFEKRGSGYSSYLIQKFKDQVAHAHLETIQIDEETRLS